MVKTEKQGRQYICSVVFEHDKKASMIYAPALPFTVCAENAEGKNIYKNIDSDYFKKLIADILHFYETGAYSFDTAQTLEIMKLRTGVIHALEHPGEYVSL